MKLRAGAGAGAAAASAAAAVDAGTVTSSLFLDSLLVLFGWNLLDLCAMVSILLKDMAALHI